MKYEIKVTNVFKKSLKKCKKRNYDLKLLEEVINLLVKGETLPEKYKDHQLVNTINRECHIKPNWLLVYRYEKDKLILILVDTGTHSDLFK